MNDHIVEIEYGRWQVYDDRSGQIVFQSNYKSECIDYMNSFAEDSDEFNHLWLK